jgi:outer membrane protein assembly factor BamA
MLPTKLQSFFTAFAAAGLFILIISSCNVVPRNYPTGKPFVYETNIRLEGNFSKEENARLVSQLKDQLHDSIRVRTAHKLLYKGINRPVLDKPPVYDSVNAENSVRFMQALLRSLGYFRDSIAFDTTLAVEEDETPPQYRTTVNFKVKPGKLITLDSIRYNIAKPELQTLTTASLEKSFLKKGVAFSKQTISSEFDRLVEIYRDNGYLLFSREELVGIWDTLDIALLRPNIDPFEQILLLDSLRKKRMQNPTANLEIRLRPGFDSRRLIKYFVGHTTVYPDFSADTLGLAGNFFSYDSSFSFKTYRDIFKRHFITQNIYFRRGDLYVQKKFLKTINRFNSLGAWRLVNIEPLPRPDADTVDFNMYLTPADKYQFTANIEGSRNNSNSIIFEENLFGVGVNVQLLNRNFGRSSNQSATNARYSTEIDTKGEFVKTRQASISHTINFPKPIPNTKWIPEKFRDNFRTQLAFSLSNVVRSDFFDLISLNASWGYNFSWKNKSVNIKFPNIEYANIKKRDSLINFLNSNPSLRNVFPENGLVLSLQGGFNIRGGRGNAAQIFRVNLEESGLLTSLTNLKIFDSLFKFVKLDAEFIRNVQFRKSSFVFRAYAGVGFAMTTKDRSTNPNLPFFKQFSVGGPSSMRAWGLRTLGPGSTLKTRDDAPFRFGDFIFETNAEFRFPLTTIAGFKINSCLFADIGNVWFRRPNPDFPDGNLRSDFYKDLAAGIGTGLRIDFEFFLLRLDYGLKIKNPTPEPVNADGQYKWFYNFKPFGGILQLGINYPFQF